jgi:hypothetical protein
MTDMSIGSISTPEQLDRAVERLCAHGVTDPGVIADRLIEGRTSSQMRVIFNLDWATLSVEARRRTLRDAFLASQRN